MFVDHLANCWRTWRDLERFRPSLVHVLMDDQLSGEVGRIRRQTILAQRSFETTSMLIRHLLGFKWFNFDIRHSFRTTSMVFDASHDRIEAPGASM